MTERTAAQPWERAERGQETLYVAATDRGIRTSDDQGQTFTTRYPE
jgi:hypothetical protein